MFIVLGLYSRSKVCFCLNLCRPPGTYSIRPIEKLLNCQQRDDVLLQAFISMGSNQKQRCGWVREIIWYLYTSGVRGRMKAKQRWFKVTRELCHEWFHHFRHHVHDGHWTGEFATVIWRLHGFTVSCRGDVRGESGPQITRLSQLENYAMGTWPIFKNSLSYQTG